LSRAAYGPSALHRAVLRQRAIAFHTAAPSDNGCIRRTANILSRPAEGAPTHQLVVKASRRFVHVSPVRPAPPLVPVIYGAVIGAKALLSKLGLGKLFAVLATSLKALGAKLPLFAKLKPLIINISSMASRFLPFVWRVTGKKPKYRPVVIAVSLLPFILSGSVVATSFDQNPMTKRWRVILFTRENETDIGKEVVKGLIENLQSKQIPVVPEHHELHLAIDRVKRKILAAVPPELCSREDLMTRVWRIVIVPSKERNAFATPLGTIFLYAGMIEVAGNEEGLASVLAHEMSHVLARHGMENLSRASALAVITGLVASIPIAKLTWPLSLVTTFKAFVASMMVTVAQTFFTDLPYSRWLEKEADDMGVELMARAGYNPLSAVKLWTTMMDLGDTEFEVDPTSVIPAWMNTHPTHQQRIANLTGRINEVWPIYAERAQLQSHRKMVDSLGEAMFFGRSARTFFPASVFTRTRDPIEYWANNFKQQRRERPAAHNTTTCIN